MAVNVTFGGNISLHGNSKATFTAVENGSDQTGTKLKTESECEVFVNGEKITNVAKDSIIEITVNGKKWKYFGSEVSVKIVGDVETIQTASADISVEGYVTSARTDSGNISVSGSITGGATTKSGSITAGRIAKASSIDGPVGMYAVKL